jgi:hypothetical protein
MKQAEYDERFDRLSRVALKKGATVEVRKGHKSEYTDEGEWMDTGVEPFTNEVAFKEIPEELREGVALLFLGYMRDYVKPFCDELYTESQKKNAKNTSPIPE